MEDVLVECTPNIMTAKKIAELIECSNTTVLAYIGRAEFSHIRKIRVGHRQMYTGVTQHDIERLAALINARKKGRGKFLPCSFKEHVI